MSETYGKNLDERFGGSRSPSAASPPIDPPPSRPADPRSTTPTDPTPPNPIDPPMPKPIDPHDLIAVLATLAGRTGQPVCDQVLPGCAGRT